MRTGRALSIREARALAIDAQGLGRTRPTGPIGRRHLRTSIEAIGTIQLDAINVVERTQFLVLYSRLGAYDVQRLHDLSGPDGELFEYWGHAASLLPTVRQPLFRWRMSQAGPYGDSPLYAARRDAWQKANAAYIAATLDEVRQRGPLAASQLTDPRRRDGEWWERRGLGRQALEWLFGRGELAGWRAPNFERVYDLPERVIPEAVLAQPTPTVEEAHRRLLLLASHSLGVATVRDLADYYRIKPKFATPRVVELVEAGELTPVTVEGWGETAYVPPDARIKAPKRDHATLLSPFDSLIWDRDRTRRLFDFDFRIEVYVPEPDRRHGYYVMPLLLGDALVGRLDLKADRKASTLRVAAAHIEPEADNGEVAEAAATELRGLGSWLGLAAIAVRPKGPLAAALDHACR